LRKKLVAGVTQALRIVDRLAGADTKQDVVRLVIALFQVVHVVGDDEREIQILCEREQPSVDDLLFLDALVLHFEKKVVLTENVAKPARSLERWTRLLHLQRACDLPFEAAAQPDQSFRVLRQQLLVDPRSVVKPLGVTGRHELDQILVAFVGFGEQDQVIRVRLRARLLESASLGDVDLAPEDRLQPAVTRVVVEHDRREHVAVLGDRKRRHLEPHRFVEQLVDPARAIQQRELRMKVKVDELVHASTFSLLSSCSCSVRSSMFGVRGST